MDSGYQKEAPYGKVLIDKQEYIDLKNDSLFLEVLQNNGVDTWIGYEIAAKNAFEKGAVSE